MTNPRHPESTPPQSGKDDRLKEILDGAKFTFGLRAQGHLPTIERMLAEGASWADIGRAINWCPDTAREWYEREVAQ